MTKDNLQQHRVSKARPYMARVTSINGLCNIQQAGDKNTIQVGLDIGGSGLTYEPGDALGMHVCNAPQVLHTLRFSCHIGY